MPGALVQTKSGSAGVAASQIIVTFDSGLTQHNLLLVNVGFVALTTKAISSITDQSNNVLTFTEPQAIIYQSGPTAGSGLAVIQDLPAGITGIKVNLSAAADFGSNVVADEFSGLITSSAINQSDSQSPAAPGTGTDAITSGTITPSSNPGILYSGICCVTAGTIANVGTGFTSAGSHAGASGEVAFRTEYKRLTSNSGTTATATDPDGGGNKFNQFTVYLLEAAGGGARPGLLLMGCG